MKLHHIHHHVKIFWEISRIRMLIVFVLLCALFLLLAIKIFYFLQTEQKNFVSNADDIISERIASLYTEISDLPSGAGNDVIFLSNFAGITNNKTSQDTEILKNQFAKFLEKNITYQNVSMVDPDGHVSFIIGRDSNGHISEIPAPIETLSNQVFFERTINLQKEEVYISDLQRDFLTSSPNPVMYYATLVTDNTGKINGILLLTVDAKYFLSDIRNFSRPGERVFLISDLGEYLASPDTSKEGIIKQTSANFKTDYPDVAAKILSISNKRMIQTADKIFVWRYIQPTMSTFEIFKAINDTNVKNLQKNFYWVLVSVSDRSSVDTVLLKLAYNNIYFLGYIFVIMAVIGIILISLYRLAVKRNI